MFYKIKKYQIDTILITTVFCHRYSFNKLLLHNLVSEFKRIMEALLRKDINLA